MSAIAKENLDERIERMKKRNEEIEKKYREAEEDRLRALKENAMVETKPPKDEDWPRTHKYDKIDFTYDVKPEKLEELSIVTKAVKEEKMQPKRDYKKFPEGEGPPPDPAYNFLADAERDGIVISKSDKTGNNRDRDSKQNQNNQNSAKNQKDQQQYKRGGPNGSFRGRGGKSHNPKYQKQNSQPEYEQWRSERERIDEARISRQKVGEGKWRREWDNDKLNSENEALLRAERITLGDAITVAAKKSPIQHGGNTIEKRGNITVSVSQTGEVKSVKLTSAPVIGTGRVGPRQITKPQFSIQSVEKEFTIGKTVPLSPKPQHKLIHKQNTNPNLNNSQTNKPITRRDTAPNFNHTNNNPQQQQKQQSQNLVKQQQKAPHKQKSQKYIPPAIKAGGAVATAAIANTPVSPVVPNSVVADLPPESASELVAIDLSHKPEFAKKSVQDRLLRIRQSVPNETGAPIDNELSTNSSSVPAIKATATAAANNIESNTTNCDLKLTSNRRNEVVGNDDPNTSCDKNSSNDSSIVAAIEPIAAAN